LLNINYINSSDLVIPSWKATYILRPDLMVLSASLLEYGFVQPIHVRSETMEVIDGSERVLLAQNVEAIKKKTKGIVPVVEHECDSIDAMMLHLRLNRGRSSLVGKKVSSITRKLNMSGRYSRADFENLLCMKTDEFDLMMTGDLLRARKINEHTYSKAWVPIEAPPGTVDHSPVIERPPNPDR
jgi:hypothetical protein